MNPIYVKVHASHPQPRVVRRSAAILEQGGVIVCPTDACYSLVCLIGNKLAEDRIRGIRQLSNAHYFTLLCRDVSELAAYGKLSNAAFRLIKMLTPGPYTFLLPATRETPRRLQDPKRKTIGIRIPSHPYLQAVFAALGGALLSSTCINDAIGMPYAEAAEIAAAFGHGLDAVVDGGSIGIEMTTIIDLTGTAPNVVRAGKGDVSRVPDLQLG
jgi:tRNA threonylcarbamoyl adenosine modification protein (Sua5/YciO/YrdC/YwlC family)